MASPNTQHVRLDPKTEAINAQLKAFEEGSLAAGATMVAAVAEIAPTDGKPGFLWRIHADSQSLVPAIAVLISRLTPSDFVMLFECMARNEAFEPHRSWLPPGEYVHMLEDLIKQIKSQAAAAKLAGKKVWKN